MTDASSSEYVVSQPKTTFHPQGLGPSILILTHYHEIRPYLSQFQKRGLFNGYETSQGNYYVCYLTEELLYFYR